MATEQWIGGTTNFITGSNWVSTNAPVSGGSALFPAMAAAATTNVAGSDQSAILLVTTEVEPENYSTYGSRGAPLILDTDNFIYAGAGESFFMLKNSTAITVNDTAAGGSSSATYGLYLNGTTNALLTINAGNVGVGAFDTDSATFTTIVVNGGTVDIGPAVTNTTLSIADGTVTNQSAATTVNVGGGTYTHFSGAVTTINLTGGTLDHRPTILPNITMKGGTLDLSKCFTAKTTGVITWTGGTINDPNGVLAGIVINKGAGVATL